ncbi:MAG: TonB-dependent receptor [Gelidibacter sp.]
MITKILRVIVLLMSCNALGQNMTISGNVKDNGTNQPLPGVNIIIKNTSKGTTTDFDGNYSLNDVPVNSVLVFSYVGFVNQEITVKNGSPINVVLLEDSQALDEVVLIGYGTQKKKDVTGAVSLVSSETIQDLKPVDAALALQGTSSGVTVNSSSGSPGASFNILIRGISSNGNNAPLFIVDGYEGSFNSINPNDIESISVLKDAQASIYGIKGANGVVLIQTKSGKKNSKPKFSYDVYTGIQETTRKLPYLDATEYAILINESYANNGQALPYPNISELGTGTDWQDEVFDTAPMTNHNVSLSGGSENMTYYFGAGRLEQDGIIARDKSNFERNNIKITLAVDVSKKIKFTTNANYFSNSRKGFSENTLGSVLFNALNYSPLFDINEEDVNGLLGNEVINPVSQIRNTFNAYTGSGLEGNFQLEYKVFEGFTATSRVGYKTYKDNNKSFSPIVNYGVGKVFNNARSRVDQSKTAFNTYTWETFLNYNKTFAEMHHVTATIGTSAQRNWGDGLYATGFDVPNNSWEFADISLANGLSDAKSNSSYVFDNRLTSYFGRLQYDFMGKYFISGIVRRDAASDFSPDNRVDYFKSATAGWKVSDEEFLEDSDVINLLKFRGSYGTIGNNVGADLYRALLSGEATYVFDGQLVSGVATGVFPNPKAQWETAEKLDIGLDLGLFNDKLELTADYFREDRNDLLITGLPVSGILGTSAPGSGNPTVNAGTTRSKGFEFLISYKDDLSDNFSFGIAYNFTNVKGEVLSINGDAIPQGGAFSVGQQAPSRMEVGQPIGYFYGLQTDGIFQNQAEVDAHPSQAALGAPAAPGDFRFKDINNDGVINFDDRTNLGNPQAEYLMGLNLNFKYRNFDFLTYMYAEIGKEMIRNYERSQPNVNRSTIYLDRWTGEGTSNTVPRVTTGATTNKLFSDFYVEDASFLRIQNIQLGYSLSTQTLDKIGMSKVRLYVTVNNPFTLTKYMGYDPAATSGAAIGGGIDYGFYPISRQYLLGLNLSL